MVSVCSARAPPLSPYNRAARERAMLRSCEAGRLVCSLYSSALDPLLRGLALALLLSRNAHTIIELLCLMWDDYGYLEPMGRPGM